MTDPRPLAERVRDIARAKRAGAIYAENTGCPTVADVHRREAATLHEAADALEARKDQP